MNSRGIQNDSHEYVMITDNPTTIILIKGAELAVVKDRGQGIE